jgi:carboxylate-amine ligase
VTGAGDLGGTSDFTLGVEEEFFLCDAETGELRPHVDRVLVAGREADAHIEPELQRWQVETGTGICATLDEVRADLTRLRRELVEVAGSVGCRVVAAATHPLATGEDAHITPKVRYLRMAERFGQLARDQLVCGCHVHVGIKDRDVAVQAMNHARVWLAPLIALSGNSPFWMGQDTGYASYRSQVWSRWPTAGPPEVFASRAEYDAMVGGLLGSGVIGDLGMVYLDVRPSAQFDTLEFRVADVCLTVDEAVLVAGLTRALAQTAVQAALDERPPPQVRPELIRVAHWRAARSGVTGELVDLATGRPVPAPQLLWSLVEHVRPALEAQGDLDQVRALVEQVLVRGTGAARQRAAHQRRGELRDVLDLLVTETTSELG